jgi:DNA-binding NarL/FixJ family response regulator
MPAASPPPVDAPLDPAAPRALRVAVAPVLNRWAEALDHRLGDGFAVVLGGPDRADIAVVVADPAAVAALRRRRPRLGLVVVDGLAPRRDAREVTAVLEAGADAYFAGSSPDELTAIVRALARRLRAAARPSRPGGDPTPAA